MKIFIFLVFVFLLHGCSSGGNGSVAPSISSSSSHTPELSEAEQTILDHYTKVPYSAVTGLKTLADFPIGLEVQAGEEERSIFQLTEQQDLIVQHFSELVAGIQMKAPFLHPQEGQFYFEDADELVYYAQSNGMRMHGHTLIWYFHDG